MKKGLFAQWSCYFGNLETLLDEHVISENLLPISQKFTSCCIGNLTKALWDGAVQQNNITDLHTW
jgi:hypothetical protein